MRVTVHVDADTRTVEAVLVDGAKVVDYEVVVDKSQTPLPAAVVVEFCPRAERDAALQRGLRLCSQPRALVAVPWRDAHVPAGCAFVDCAAYVLPASRAPERASFFPVNWRYAAGFAMVEIEAVLDEKTSSGLTSEFFMTRQFQERQAALAAAVRGANRLETLPGFILPDTAKHLAPFAHTGSPRDPLLAQFRPDYARTSPLRLQQDDYIAFATSAWTNVSKETKAMAGHAETSRHYYAIVKYGLPPETVDQLKMLLYTNPNADAWAKLVSRKPFERALDLARAQRAKFLVEALEAAGLQPKKSNPHVLDTATDIFDDQPAEVASPDGTATAGVVFYAGCAATHRAARGLVTEAGPERDAGLIWLHGPPSSAVGGTSWQQPATVHSLPVYASARATVRTLESFVAAGWSREWGYAKVEPIVFV